MEYKGKRSGKFITAADYATLNDVSTAAGGTNPVELYAYWADAPVTPGKFRVMKHLMIMV